MENCILRWLSPAGGWAEHNSTHIRPGNRLLIAMRPQFYSPSWLHGNVLPPPPLCSPTRVSALLLDHPTLLPGWLQFLCSTGDPTVLDSHAAPLAPGWPLFIDPFSPLSLIPSMLSPILMFPPPIFCPSMLSYRGLFTLNLCFVCSCFRSYFIPP